MIIDGKKIAEDLIKELKNLPKPKKFLAAFLISENPASVSFLKQKEKVAKELGVDFRLYKFSTEIKQDELRKEILKIVSSKTCGGAIIQLPLPESINRQYVLNVIPREKDVDVLGERALGAFYAGRNSVLPPAVGVVKTVIVNCKLKIENCRVAVVGLGSLIGKPIANWLMGKAPEIYLLDEGSDLKILGDADLIISGVGKANLFSAKNLKANAMVIDFGYDMSGGNIAGDFNLVRNSPSQDPSGAPSAGEISNGVNPKALMPSASINYTPTPGGTGPILVAKLFENFFKLNAE